MTANDNGWPGPYAAAAKYYVQTGWLDALPLPPNRKDPVPAGFTGWRHFDIDPTMRDIERWVREQADGNIALRMPRDVIGIDVDAYGGKAGEASLRAAEERFGPLPATWRTTSRDDGISGIRFYQVPEGMKWPNTVGPGIEMIHRGHRYAVAPPSVHPETQRPYQWVSPTGEAGFSFPRPSGLPWLPDSWVRGLTAGEMATGAVARSEPPASAQGWLTPGEPCRAVLGQLERVREAFSAQGSRHDNVRDLLLAVLFLGQQGHGGVDRAIRAIHATYVREVGPDRDSNVETEWQRMLFGAFEIIAASPRQPEVCRGPDCGTPEKFTTPAGLTGPQWVVDPEQHRRRALEDLEDLWDQRPELGHVRDFARARMASPWATLGVTLVRAVCQIPPMVVLPAIIGGQASLNLFVAVVGPSGSGKQAAEGASRDAFYFGTHQEEVNLGSGEGIVRSYAKYVPPKGDLPGGVDQFETSVLFRAAEIDSLAAVKGRSGATIMPAIRDAWMGDSLGWGYAAAEKRIGLQQHSYRMGIVVGVQPDRAAALLGSDEADGGTPQRFLWLPAQDPLIPEETPAEPDRWQWSAPKFAEFGFQSVDGRKPMDIPDAIVATVRQAAIDRHRGLTEALDGHRLLAQLKVAAALAFLACRTTVTMDDWDLAGVVMAKSDATRLMAVRTLEDQRARQDEAKLRFEERKTERVEKTRESTAARSLEKTLRRKLSSGDWVKKGEISRALGSKERRDLFTELVDDFVAAGWLEQQVEAHAKVKEGIVSYRLRKDQ